MRNNFFSLNLFILFISSITVSYAQLGGVDAFNFLTVPTNARQVGLGGFLITSGLDDPNAMFYNSALLGEESVDKVVFNYYDYHTTAGMTSLGYAKQLGGGIVGFGMAYMGYGEFDGFDQNGNYTGTYNANDYWLQGSYTYKQGVFSFSANMKFAASKIESYKANALMFDMNGAFIHPTKDLVVGLSVKNAGFVMRQYQPNDTSELPFDTQLGLSFKPERMPLRFSVTYHHIHQFDITYTDTSLKGEQDAFGNDLYKEPTFADKLSRHFAFGGEFVLGKVVNVRAGYNVMRRKEMITQGVKGMAGMSLGAALKIKKHIDFGYSVAWYHVAGPTNSLSLSIATKGWDKRKKTVIE
ncbi:type IX secretion system protein PorQ [Flammeovirga agarivorans]|uniref:Type IX secretion system protein PorQ n=1 Tax=Flammeovirga agarivorans TaxID=2726742 RepID=A0A7X8SG85_9BACT|nr:type IX secretion system protein PorQ [Flammeovirga agarivorans]NLR89694.1 type IX secretion system protein PorQ [Flammeovirga agarivorans]